MSKLLKLKMDIKKDSLLDLKRYYYTYGSLTHLQEFMNEKCEDYIKSSIANQWSKEIEDLNKLKREKFVSTLGMWGSIVTVFLTLLLSFPAIKQIAEAVGLNDKSITLYIIFNFVVFLLLALVFIRPFFRTIQDLLLFIKDKLLFLKFFIKSKSRK